MDLLEKKEHYINLYDFYEALLSEKQQEYFRQYYFDDLSLAEIAEQYQVSRNAIYDHLKKTAVLLDQYEEKLGLVRKYQKRKEIYDAAMLLENESVQALIQKLKETE
ncbi:MAG: hypothetical protein GX661_01825 [Acholeplasmataceae bacterium]|nr:hypothetical protein [Acholeplasmataceae bacterium]